jgi:DNA mismatch endonuclease, patch repair protein
MCKVGLQSGSEGVPPSYAARSQTGRDTVSRQVRSRMMASVCQKDTKAEMAVRKILHALGIRFRIRNRDLPGSPDIANRRARWAVFVNGCFWHGHKNCLKTKSTSSPRVPRTHTAFWSEKFLANRARDARQCRKLRQLGYRVLIVWECSLAQKEALAVRLSTFCAGGDGRRGFR